MLLKLLEVLVITNITPNHKYKSSAQKTFALMTKLKLKRMNIMEKMILCINITCEESIPAQGNELIDYFKNIESDILGPSLRKIKDKITNSNMHAIHINPYKIEIDYVQYIENFLKNSPHKLVIFNIDIESRIFTNSIVEPVKGLARINGWLRIFSSLPRNKRNQSGILVNDFLLSIEAAMKILEKNKNEWVKSK